MPCVGVRMNITGEDGQEAMQQKSILMRAQIIALEGRVEYLTSQLCEAAGMKSDLRAELFKPGHANKKRLMAILGAGPRAKTGGVG